MKKNIGIIGSGRLGHALASALVQKTYPVAGINDKDLAKGKTIADKLGIDFYDNYKRLAEKSDILFLAVPDSIIIPAAKEIIASCKKPLVLLHPSGALSAYALPEAENASRGSFHPLQSFVSENTVFKDIYITMDGDEKALEAAKALCRILEARPLLVPAEDRALYHAAACMASNYLVTLLSEVEDIFSLWANTPKEARQAFWPLIKGTVDNFEKFGKPALTGPIARGDISTLKKHLAILPDKYESLYTVMAQYTAKLAFEQDMITEEKSDEIKSFLKGE